MPVDLYIGGAEHAVLHLLYARFWHKALYDLGHVSTPEPFKKLFNQGMMTADAFQDERGVYIDIREVEFRDGEPVEKETGKGATPIFRQNGQALQKWVAAGRGRRGIWRGYSAAIRNVHGAARSECAMEHGRHSWDAALLAARLAKLCRFGPTRKDRGERCVGT